MVLDEQVAVLNANDPLHQEQLLPALPVCRSAVRVAGPKELLRHRPIGVLCSSTCPGSIVLKAFDAVTWMRDQGQVLIGGFHSVMERECLGILLRGCQPIIWVPARSIAGMRLRPELVPVFEAGRLLVLSPFAEGEKRMSLAHAEVRNRFVASLADRIFVPHAAEGSRTLSLCRELAEAGKAMMTIDDPANEQLLQLPGVARFEMMKP